MSTNVRIAIADDHEIFRKTLADALVFGTGFDVVFLAENGVELLFELDRKRVDVVILDLNMPVMSGNEALLIINEKHPKTKVIVLSSYDNQLIMIDTLRKGAHAYLPKKTSIEELIDAIYSVKQNGFYLPDNLPTDWKSQPTQIGSINDSNPSSVLSDRELAVLRLICEEKCSREIADILHISERTVENHRYKIAKKIGTSHAVGMLIYALQNGVAKITADGKIDFGSVH